MSPLPRSQTAPRLDGFELLSQRRPHVSCLTISGMPPIAANLHRVAALAFEEILAAKPSSFISRNITLAQATVSPTGTSNPVVSASMISSGPPHAVLITGIP